MKKLRELRVKTSYIIWALKRMMQPQIGDVVKYKEEECFLIQGVSNPYWDLMPTSKENFDRSERIIYKYIHISEFKIDKSVKRKLWSFKIGYRFKMQNWFLIDTWNKKLLDPIYKLK